MISELLGVNSIDPLDYRKSLVKLRLKTLLSFFESDLSRALPRDEEYLTDCLHQLQEDLKRH